MAMAVERISAIVQRQASGLNDASTLTVECISSDVGGVVKAGGISRNVGVLAMTEGRSNRAGELLASSREELGIIVRVGALVGSSEAAGQWQVSVVGDGSSTSTIVELTAIRRRPKTCVVASR